MRNPAMRINRIFTNAKNQNKMKSNDKIKLLRTASGLGLLRFSRRCGVSLNTIVNAEKRGVRSVKVARKIADACGVDISQVL